METYETEGDYAEVFPKGVAVHPLLAPFFSWLDERPWGSVGYFFGMPGNGDELVPAEVSVDEDFAMVLRLSDGSLAGFWLAETRDIEEAPFAVFSSDGELNLVAPNFPCFLDRLANQDWSEYEASADFLVEEPEEDDDYEDEEDEDSVPDSTPELRAWLDSQSSVREFIERTRMTPADIKEKLDGGRAQRWIDAKVEAGEQALKNDPVRGALVQALRDNGVKEGAFRVFAAGDQMIIKSGMAIIEGPHNKLKKVPKALESDLRPHLFAAREALAQSKTGVGLWTSASLMVTAQGHVDISPSPDHELTIGNDAFPAQLFADDQARYPRKASLMAPWLSELIAGAE